ncbi:Arginase/deacetylase [Artomyces pyxidatus]|uniref:Arginase/deacetylase n=1 Tax=Artomyces pyxidatus TaxID=48021 RepID=A0ACB8SJC7_9AGAM|nr:Arginase/deacetylase [Artomyces pyxidatus]
MEGNVEQNKRRRVVYVASETLAKVSSRLPSNKNRSLLVHALVTSLGLTRSTESGASIAVLRPSPATQKDLAVYHDREYVQFLLDPASAEGTEDMQSVEFGLEDDCPPFKGMREYVQAVAGASLAAACALAEDQCDVAVCWDGGRHHAHKSHASGFCYVNDCVLALLALKHAPAPAPSRKPRIMYLDLDLHFCDAVAAAFHAPASSSSSPPQVLTLSLHHAARGFFPSSPLAMLSEPHTDPFTLALPLLAGATNATFARVWTGVIERVRGAFDPDYVVVQCGCDGLAGDPCGVWNWAVGGEGGMGWCVTQVLGWGCKTLLLGGGGYNSPNAARAWAYLTSVTRGDALALDTQIPDHGAFPLYAPSFTLDVPPGNVRDENTEEYLTHVEGVFEGVVQEIVDRLGR